MDELPKASVASVGSGTLAAIGAPEAVKVEELPVSDAIEALIRDGTEGDRSGAVYRVVRAIIAAGEGISPEQMLSVLTDAEFGIRRSASSTRRPGRSRSQGVCASLARLGPKLRLSSP